MAKARRSSCSFAGLLLSCLNFTLFILAAASLAPTVLIKMPPTSFGTALIMVSAMSILSSFLGFYSQLAHFCFVTHTSLALASLVAQMLAVLALFWKESSSLALLKSARDPREAKLLVRLECGALVAMLMMQLVALGLSCAVNSFGVREYGEIEAETEAVNRKRSMRIAKVQEESMANAAKTSKDSDEKMKHEHVKLELEKN